MDGRTTDAGVTGELNMDIFLDMKILWIFLRVITKLNYIKGSFLCILGSFLKVRVQNGGCFFGVAKILNIFLGCLKFLIFFISINLGGRYIQKNLPP